MTDIDEADYRLWAMEREAEWLALNAERVGTIDPHDIHRVAITLLNLESRLTKQQGTVNEP